MTTRARTGTRLLYISHATDVRPALSLMFGELVKLAAPVLTHFHGDLYHDALWLHQHVTGDTFTFYWSVRATGTTIGTEAPTSQCTHAYRFTMTCRDGDLRYERAGG